MKNIGLYTAIVSVFITNLAFAATPSAASPAQKLKDVAPYPAVNKDSNRHVIWLKNQPDESQYKVEIVATKSGLKDCNNVSYNASFNEKVLEGWGYDYYTVESIQGPISTQMACSNTKKVKANLPVHLGDKSLLRYNSKLPLVIYAPKDVDVSYRIWQAPKTTQKATIVNN